MNAPLAELPRAFPAPSATCNRIPAAGTTNPSGNVSAIATSKTPPAPDPVLSTTIANRRRSAASTSAASASGAPPASASLVTVPVKPGATALGPGSNQVTPVGSRVSVMVRPLAFGLPAPITPLAMSSTGSASTSCTMLVDDVAAPNELAERFTTWLVKISPSRNADAVTPTVNNRSISDGLFAGSSCVAKLKVITPETASVLTVGSGAVPLLCSVSVGP